MLGKIKAFFSDESGATAMEYALIATLIAIALLATFTVLGDGIENLFNNGAADVLNEQSGKI